MRLLLTFNLIFFLTLSAQSQDSEVAGSSEFETHRSYQLLQKLSTPSASLLNDPRFGDLAERMRARQEQDRAEKAARMGFWCEDNSERKVSIEQNGQATFFDDSGNLTVFNQNSIDANNNEFRLQFSYYTDSDGISKLTIKNCIVTPMGSYEYHNKCRRSDERTYSRCEANLS